MDNLFNLPRQDCHKEAHAHSKSQRCVAAATIVLFMASPGFAQVRSMSTEARRGNSSVGAYRYDLAQADATANTLTVRRRLDCSLFKKTVLLCARQAVDATRESSLWRVDIGGKTILSIPMPKGPGTVAIGPNILNVWQLEPVEVFSFGVFSVRATGQLGAGYQANASWEIWPKPNFPELRKVDLVGSAQTWANGNGKIKVSLLYGVAQLILNADLRMFNNTLSMDLHATPKDIGRSHATLVGRIWSLFLQLKAKVLFHVVARKTIVQEAGPVLTYPLF
jgi:hypothetical protein